MSVIRTKRKLFGQTVVSHIWVSALLAVGAIAIGGTFLKGSAPNPKSPEPATKSMRAIASPTQANRFIQNAGQWDGQAKFAIRSPGTDVWVTDKGMVFDFYKSRVEAPAREQILKGKKLRPKTFRSGHVVELEFLGASPAGIVGQQPYESKMNYLAPGGTMNKASVFGETRMIGLYPGVDARLYMHDSKFRYDLEVHPGSDPNQIRFKFDGADRVSATSPTSISLDTSLGDIQVSGLYAYQHTSNGQRQIDAKFDVDSTGTVRFKVGEYDRSKKLIIDPVVYSSLLGGIGSNDIGENVFVDATVHGFVSGSADGLTFPTTFGAYNETPGQIDGFVTKFTADGSDIIFSTLVGGPADDFMNDFAVDPSGNIFLCGETTFDGLGTPGAFQENIVPAYMPRTRNRNVPVPPTLPDVENLYTEDDKADAFMMKLSSDGSTAIYFTYLGGVRYDSARSIAIDSTGSAVVCGVTQSGPMNVTSNGRVYADLVGPFFPLANAAQPNFNGTPANNDGDGDAFLTKLNADGTALVFSTYVGGPDQITFNDLVIPDPPASTTPIPVPLLGATEWPDNPWDDQATHGDDEAAGEMAIDASDNIYMTAATFGSPGLISPNGFDRTANNLDAVVCKLSPTGALIWGTYIGGNDSDQPTGIDVDVNDNAYITGVTSSFNFPKTIGVFDRIYNNGQDSFVTKINREGTGLVYSTYLGTTGAAAPLAIDVDDLGYAHVGGAVGGQTLPTTANADDTTWNGPPLGTDGYIEVLNENGTALQYCSYWGGSSNDVVFGIAADGARNAYVTGYTFSDIGDQIPFPTTPDAFKVALVTELLQTCDAFFSKIKTRIPIAVQSLALNPTSVVAGESSTGTVTLSGPASVGGMTVSLSNNNGSIASHPASIFLGEGSTSGTFTITTTSILAAPATVRITAFTEGDSKFADLFVSPWLSAFTLSNDTVVGGNLITGRVTIFKAAPTGGITVSLLSEDPSIVSVPSTAVVPAGMTTASFDVTSVGVAAPQSVDLSASHNGVIKTVTLTVLPANLLAISFLPNVVSGGISTNGTVTLDGFAPLGGITVALASNNAALTVPPTVIVAQNTNSISFVANTSAVASNTSVTITATYNAVVRTTFVDLLPMSLVSLTLVPSTVQGGNVVVGSVGLDFPTTGGSVTVNLLSSNPSVAPVPSTVVIPAGSTIESFNIPTTIVTSQTVVTISATFGATTINADLTIDPITFDVTIAPGTVNGGQAAVGTVTLTAPAPISGTTITLSSNSSAAIVPSSIVIASGASTGTFSVATTPVAVDTTATITASFSTSSDTADLIIRAPRVTNLNVSPNTVSGGASATGVITMTGNSPAGGTTVNLSSDNVAAVVNPTVIVAQGSSTASFNIATTSVASNTTATITASANTGSDSDTLLILGADLISITFTPSKVRGSQNSTMTVTLSGIAPPGGAEIDIESTNELLTTNMPDTVTIPAGSASVSVSINTRRVSRTLTTTVSATYGSTVVFATLTVTR